MRKEREGIEKGRKEKRKGARGIKRGRRPQVKNNHIPIISPSLSVMRMVTWSGLGTTPESEVLSTSEKFSWPS